MTIPEEDVEAAAKAMADAWNPERDPILTAMFRDYANSALAAAAPIICAAERKKIADEIIEITGGDIGPRSGGYYMVSMRDIMRVFKTEGSKDS